MLPTIAATSVGIILTTKLLLLLLLVVRLDYFQVASGPISSVRGGGRRDGSGKFVLGVVVCGSCSNGRREVREHARQGGLLMP